MSELCIVFSSFFFLQNEGFVFSVYAPCLCPLWVSFKIVSETFDVDLQAVTPRGIHKQVANKTKKSN